jgi:catechol 2,3-dioxygenase-like lactoylglutathione lyase family enzyme
VTKSTTNHHPGGTPEDQAALGPGIPRPPVLDPAALRAYCPDVIDHVSIAVGDLARAGAFYDAVLATLGLRRRKASEGAIGWGPDAAAPPVVWIHARRGARAATPGLGLHVSFRARSRDEVHAFHATALACGGRDAGAPGPRPEYTAGFYGAFALDPEGTKIEAVVREALVPSSR